VGAAAALLTSALWTVNAVLFTSAGKKIGAISVNAWRKLLALGLLWLAHILISGTLLPSGTWEQWFWIGLSGVVVLTLAAAEVRTTWQYHQALQRSGGECLCHRLGILIERHIGQQRGQTIANLFETVGGID
jgi:hypothetical protein